MHTVHQGLPTAAGQAVVRTTCLTTLAVHRLARDVVHVSALRQTPGSGIRFQLIVQYIRQSA